MDGQGIRFRQGRCPEAGHFPGNDIFHLLPKGRRRFRVAVGNEPKGMVFQVFDDEKVVKYPFHVGHGDLGFVAGYQSLTLHSVVIGDVANSPVGQGQVGIIFLVMALKIGLEIGFGRPRVVLAVDEEAPLFDADLMIGDEADDGVLAKTIF